MAARPFLTIGIEDLEKAFDAQRDDQAFLKTLIAELHKRKTQRAAQLRDRAMQVLGVSPKGKPTRPAATPAPATQAASTALAPERPLPRQSLPMAAPDATASAPASHCQCH